MKGQHIGYIRVSTVDQQTARQLDGLTLDKVFIDHASGRSRNRPALREMLDYVREGDTIHVHSMDRLARNVDDLRQLVDSLTGRGVRVYFRREGMEFAGDDNAMSRLLLTMLGAVAEFSRAQLLENQREGIAKAKAAGKYKGRKAILNKAQVAELKARVAAGEAKAALAREYKMSRQTLYQYLKTD